MMGMLMQLQHNMQGLSAVAFQQQQQLDSQRLQQSMVQRQQQQQPVQLAEMQEPAFATGVSWGSSAELYE